MFSSSFVVIHRTLFITSPQTTHKCTLRWYVTFAVKCCKQLGEYLSLNKNTWYVVLKFGSPSPAFVRGKVTQKAQNSTVGFYMIDRSSDKSARELLIILLTMFQLPKCFSWKFSDFHGKEQKATSHTCPTCPWSCLSQNQKEVCLVRGPPFIVHPLLTCCFPVGSDRSLQSKQLPALHGNAHALRPYPKYKTPGESFGEWIRLAANKHKADL